MSYPNQKFTSIRQLFPISNQSAETVVWNNAVPEKSKVYINPSITSNIKSISQTVIWNNTVPKKSKVYINPSIISNIKSISRDSRLKQRCSREVKSLHQSVNYFQYQINQSRQSFETTLFPRSQKFTSIRQLFPISNQSAKQLFETTLFPRSQKFTPIRQPLPISNQSAKTVVRNNAVTEKSYRFVDHFQYQINQPRQLFETTLCSNRSNNQQ
jgi:hypothetical protein